MAVTSTRKLQPLSFIYFLKICQPFFSGLGEGPNVKSTNYGNSYCKNKYQNIHNYLSILLANNADNIVSTNPNVAAHQILRSPTLVNKGKMIPITRPAKESFDISKKYPANFSRLILSLSFLSLITSNCFYHFPISHLIDK